MNQTGKLIVIIGGIASAVAGLTTLGVVYARFEQAQKTIQQTTLGDVLREKKAKIGTEELPEETEAPVEEEPTLVEAVVQAAAETVAVKLSTGAEAKKKVKKEEAPKNG